MYIQVKLIKGYAQPLWYQIPDDWPACNLIGPNLIGTIVHVPFRTSTLPAIVVKKCDKIIPAPSFAIKKATSIEPFPNDPTYHQFIQKLASYHCVDSMHFIRRMRQFFSTKKKVINAAPPTAHPKNIDVQLTQEQQSVVEYLKPLISTPTYAPTLIHGVTGSGKTEIYKKLIIHAHKQNKTSVLLLPEVTLAVNFYHLLKAQLPADIPLFTFHSATSAREKKLLWQSLLNNTPIIIIGVHLPILLPLPNLGVIIIDEEHETGFQEKKHPKVNSKEAAIWRAHMNNIPIVLGSATPSLSSLYNVKQRNWKLFQIKKRFAGAFPTVQTVYLTDKKQRRNFWISTPLEQAIKDRLAKKEQAIIFLNRRGFSFFVQCKPCGAIFSCSACSVSLTLHDGDRLSCHYCGQSMPLPKICSSCNASSEHFLTKGIGTQQVVRILQKTFPLARIERADMDSTVNKTRWQQIVDDFTNQKIDILVGTQTITKGYHFPNVTLVGILWADINLHFPIYNAAETTLQQLIQVAGRAGRQHEHSDVIVQTLTEHPIFNYLNEVDYLKFYHEEIENRTIASYPPYGRLVEIEIRHSQEEIAEKEAHEVAIQLTHNLKKTEPKSVILGPAKPPVHKIKLMYSRKIYIKSDNIGIILNAFKQIEQDKFKCSIWLTPNPLC